ncbi:MAG: hypothetical protein IPK25_16435 [Saprospiraceae bacterium]|nr:hypothetical protein [Saprospiraceae bacterium]
MTVIKRLFGWGDKTQIAGSLTTNILIGLATLAAIYLLPFVLKKVGVPDRIRKFIPSMFVTIVLATVLTTIFKTDVEHVSLGNTIGSFSEFFSQTISLYFPQDQGLSTFEVLNRPFHLHFN